MGVEFTSVDVSVEPADVEVTRFGAEWGWFLAAGIAAILLGFVVLVWRTETLYALTYFAGAVFLLAGCVHLADAAFIPGRRLLSLLGGLVFIAIGIIMFVWPHITLFIAAMLIALGFVAWGVMELVTAFANTKARHWWVPLIGGIVSLVVAVWAARHPGNALNVLMILLGIWIMLWGAVEVTTALVVHRMAKVARSR